MLNRFTQLRRKEVINLCDGCRLGCVGDVEVKLPEGEVRALFQEPGDDLFVFCWGEGAGGIQHLSAGLEHVGSI